MTVSSRQQKRPFRSSWQAAVAGWRLAWRERNTRVHLLAALIVTVLAAYWQVEPWQWGLLIIAIGGVIGAEMLNTAIEYVVDMISPDDSDLARDAKDIGAGAVLFASLASVLLGSIVFQPYLLPLLESLLLYLALVPLSAAAVIALVGFTLLLAAGQRRPSWLESLNITLVVLLLSVTLVLWRNLPLASLSLFLFAHQVFTSRECWSGQNYLGIALLWFAMARVLTKGGF